MISLTAFKNPSLHLIFSTHGRRASIKSDFRTDLFAYLGGIIREMDGTALIVNGTTDHAHVLVRIRPTDLPRKSPAIESKFIALGA